MGKPFTDTRVGRWFQSLSSAWKNRRAIIRVLEGIKRAVESDKAAVVTKLIPGTLDDRVLDILRRVLPVILRSVGLLDSSALVSHDAQVVDAAIKRLRDNWPKEDRGQWYNLIGTHAFLRLNNGKGKTEDVSDKIEETYQEMKAKGELA